VPYHNDAKKRVRQNEKRKARNRHYRTRMRTQIRKLRSLVEAGDHAAAVEQLPITVSHIDRVAQKGIIHRKQAARRVSRLTSAVNNLKGEGEAASA